MSLSQNLSEMERTRESYWRAYPKTSPIKLLWRALTVRHCFHVLPGESILEIGAGTGLWTEKLARVFNGENPISAAVFNQEFLPAAREKHLPGTQFLEVKDLNSDLPGESFDYVSAQPFFATRCTRRIWVLSIAC